MNDRNALEDLLLLLEEIDDKSVSLEFNPFVVYPSYTTLRAYWGSRKDRAPWGAVVVLQNAKGLILAVNGPKGIGFPGGKGETGESPWQAARRELTEETGLSIKVPAQIGKLVADNGVMTYWFATSRWSGELTSSEEGEACWLPPEDLCEGPRVRFPRFNREVLKSLDQKTLHKIREGHAEIDRPSYE
jgi:8-oxo-dGTP diphosphatase